MGTQLALAGTFAVIGQDVLRLIQPVFIATFASIRSKSVMECPLSLNRDSFPNIDDLDPVTCLDVTLKHPE